MGNNKVFKHERVRHDAYKRKVLINGGYEEFLIRRIDLEISDEGGKVESVKGVRILDKLYNKTYTFANVKWVEYKDIGKVPIERKEPLPVRSVIDVNGDPPYKIDSKELLKKHIDFRTDKFNILDIFDVKGGSAVLKGDNIFFTPAIDYEGLMSFKYIFENEYGNSVEEKTPVLLRTPDLPQDEKFYQQWYLEFINIIPVWEKYTGKNITIAVYDSGFLPNHSDIDVNIISREKFSTNQDNEFILAQHALQVAGVIAAERNDKYYVGVAYDAKIASYQAPLENPDLADLEFLKEYDIINLSWGAKLPFAITENIRKKYYEAFEDAAEFGRNGLGANLIFSSGNAGRLGVDSNYDGLKSSPYTIVVGGINKPNSELFMAEKENEKYLPSPGDNILVSAPSSDIGVLLATGIYISNDVESKDGKMSSDGTSFSAPIVSGDLALNLQANWKLGYRDKQEILVVSAVKEEQGLLEEWGWEVNKASTWNGGGYHISHQYGYGKIDALAAARLAESWPIKQIIKNLKTIKAEYTINKSIIKDNHSYDVNMYRNIMVEYVEQYVDIKVIGNIQDVSIHIISPQGTISRLLHKFLHDPVNGDKISRKDIMLGFHDEINLEEFSLSWPFGSTHFRGEESKGEWKVKIEIAGGNNQQQERTKVLVNKMYIKIYGKGEDDPKQIFYTNEFSQLISDIEKEIKSISKEDSASFEKKQALIKQLYSVKNIPEEVNKKIIVNSAALSTGVFLDLNNGNGTIDNVNIAISSKANIRHIIGTDYDDRFISPQDEGVKFILNEGNDIIELNGSNNIIVINKHSGIKTIHNFNKAFLQSSIEFMVKLNDKEEILVSDHEQKTYNLKSQCFQYKDINNNCIILDTSGSNEHIIFQDPLEAS